MNLKADDDLVIDNLRAAAGTKTQGFVTVDTSAAGTRVRIPVILLNGAGSGPTLLIASGVHGDDLNTVPMVWRLTQTIDLGRLRGQIIAIPVVNPLAFEAGTHTTPEDGLTPNFPGDASGSISRRIGYHIYHKLVVKADYVIDMHGGSRNATLAVLAHLDGGSTPEIRARAQAMAEAFAPQLIVVQADKPGRTSWGLAQAACRRGAPGVYLGMGKMGFNEADTARGTSGVINILKYLDMVDGPAEASDRQPAMTVTERYQRTPYGGGFFPAVAAGDRVEEGDPIGTVCNLFGEQVGEIHAEAAGIVDAIRFYPVVAPGDWIVSIARWKE